MYGQMCSWRTHGQPCDLLCYLWLCWYRFFSSLLKPCRGSRWRKTEYIWFLYNSTSCGKSCPQTYTDVKPPVSPSFSYICEPCWLRLEVTYCPYSNPPCGPGGLLNTFRVMSAYLEVMISHLEHLPLGGLRVSRCKTGDLWPPRVTLRPPGL